MVMSDDTAVAVGVTCSSWIVVVVSWTTCCDQCGYVPMNYQFVEFDSEQSCGRGTHVVVPILASRSVGSCREVIAAIRLGEKMLVGQVNCSFSMDGARIHDDDSDIESVH